MERGPEAGSGQNLFGCCNGKVIEEEEQVVIGSRGLLSAHAR
jgi:hypothetical protein